MSVTLIKAGLYDTLQDNGRYGFQSLGINPGGAMDRYAMQLANLLVGNHADEAVIEMHFPSPVFLFNQPCLIALAGADFSARINGEPVPIGHPIIICRNDVLQFHGRVKGARVYLAVAGGFIPDTWLGSKGTHLQLSAGGWKGRCLQKEDELLFHNEFIHQPVLKNFQVLPWQVAPTSGEMNGPILILPGNELSRLTSSSRLLLMSAAFIITPQSDRMGFRLKNTALEQTINDEILSTAVCFGTIQLLPNGQLIILMADHQTTGGYPRIANVITAHHHRLAQSGPGDSIEFGLTDQLTAEELLIKQQQYLLQLQIACTFRLEEYLHANGYQLRSR